MKPFSIIPLAALLAVAVAVPGLATDQEQQNGSVLNDAGQAVKDGAKATGNAIKNGAEAVGHGVKNAAVATGNVLGITDKDDIERYAANEKGEHRMEGTVSTVEHDRGTVGLRTDHGVLQLQFPPDSVSKVEPGDKLTVQLAFAEIPAKKTAYDQPEPQAQKMAEKSESSMQGLHWMKGIITDINHETGVMSFKTGEETLQLHFPPSAIRNLTTGQELAVELSFASKA